MSGPFSPPLFPKFQMDAPVLPMYQIHLENSTFIDLDLNQVCSIIITTLSDQENRRYMKDMETFKGLWFSVDWKFLYPNHWVMSPHSSISKVYIVRLT